PEQYSALLIDEGNDFIPEWIIILTRIADTKNNPLLVLYDDAQSIYHKNNALDFTLSSVGINSQGRSTILYINYRNTELI
ncbi:restriction endonuclease, partial [Salmonella enterica]